MDNIFRKTKSIFSVVKVAKEEPRRCGKNGELLINYEGTEQHKGRPVRRRLSTRKWRVEWEEGGALQDHEVRVVIDERAVSEI